MKQLTSLRKWAAAAVVLSVALSFVSCSWFRGTSSISVLSGGKHPELTLGSVTEGDSIDAQTNPGQSRLTRAERAWALSLLLAGRLPTQSELEQAKQSEEALALAVDTWLESPVLDERIEDIFADVLFVTAAERLDQEPIARTIRGPAFPNAEWYTNESVAAIDASGKRNNKECTSDGFLRAPLKRISALLHVDTPLTSLFTSREIWVNECSARSLGIEKTITFRNPGDVLSFERVDYREALRQSGNSHSPELAGLLTDYAFLKRYPYTPGGLNRNRANFLLKNFLGVDVALLPIPRTGDAPFPDIPTLQDARCTPCHKILDPVAHLFQNYSNTSNNFQPSDTIASLWPRGLLEKTYNPDSLPPMEWLGAQIASSDRTLGSMVAILWQGLSGQPTPGAIQDNSKETSDELLAAWKKEGLRLKSLVRLIVLHPAFFLRDVVGPNAESETASPQQLLSAGEFRDRIAAALELDSTQKTAVEHFLTENNILFGGMDHLEVTTKLAKPVATWALSVQNFSTELACGHSRTVILKSLKNEALLNQKDVSGLRAALQKMLLEELSALYWRATGQSLGHEISTDLIEFYRLGSSDPGIGIENSCGTLLADTGEELRQKLPAQEDLKATWIAALSGHFLAANYILLNDRFLTK